MTSPINDLLNGFAAILAAEAGLAWRPDGSAYVDGETPIVLRTERSGISGPQVVLNWIGLSDDIDITQGTGYLQVACIGTANDSGAADELSWPVFQALHGRTGFALGQAFIVQCNRTSSVPMGPDENTRQELADQYTCDVEWPPTPHRP